MYAVIKKYCIYHGPCEVGDVVETEKCSEYMVKIEGKPKCNVETRGPEPAYICAHNLPFPKRKTGTSCDDFIVLYRSFYKLPVAFWSITVSGGKTATLKVLNANAAATLFDKLPQKVVGRDFLFDPTAFQRQQKQDQQANADFKEAEKERLGDVSPPKRGPSGSLDPHELLKN